MLCSPIERWHAVTAWCGCLDRQTTGGRGRRTLAIISACTHVKFSSPPTQWVSEWVSRVQHPTLQIIGHVADDRCAVCSAIVLGQTMAKLATRSRDPNRSGKFSSGPGIQISRVLTSLKSTLNSTFWQLRTLPPTVKLWAVCRRPVKEENKMAGYHTEIRRTREIQNMKLKHKPSCVELRLRTNVISIVLHGQEGMDFWKKGWESLTDVWIMTYILLN